LRCSLRWIRTAASAPVISSLHITSGEPDMSWVTAPATCGDA